MPDATDAQPRPLWLDIAGVYLLVVGCVTALGVTAEHLWETPVSGNALKIDKIWVVGLAVACVFTAIIMLARENFARLLFIVVTPLAALGLARVFSPSLWENDVPYSALLVFVHVPLVFALARRGVLGACGKAESTWLSRGGAVALGCVVLAGGLRLWVTSTKPAGGRGFFAQGVALSEYVARLASADVLLWSYVGALVAVSIPSPRPREVAAAGTPRGSAASVWLGWFAATTLGAVIGRVFYEMVLYATWPIPFAMMPGNVTRGVVVTAKIVMAGALWGVWVAGLQSLVLRRRTPALREWALIGALGWALTLAASLFVIPALLMEPSDRRSDRWVVSLVLPFVGALIVACLQWTLLRRVVKRAWRWIPGAAVAHGLAVLGAVIAYEAIQPWLPAAAGRFFVGLGRAAVFGLLYGLIFGATSGLLLLWVWRKDPDPATNG